MREIKFRGRDICTGEWLYGDLRQRTGCLPSIIHSFCNNGKLDYCETPVHRDSVGQFTGVVDKNGKKIFEDDVFVHDKKYRYQVLWCNDNKGFYVEGINLADYDCIGNFYESNIEVIGNAHDSLELLDEDIVEDWEVT